MLVAAGYGVEPVSAEPPVAFEKDVAPILVKHCVRCHSPGNRNGEISLATIADLQTHEYIVPGEPDLSYFLELITAAGEDRPRMPQEGEPLSAAQVAVVRRWILEGAPWPTDVVLRERSEADASWWSFLPLDTADPPPPDGIPADWSRNPIDRWVFTRLAERHLQPNPPADRRTLIRRATYDLIGLPPFPAEVAAFVHDPDPRAYERLIDRLLSSPHYGEHWGRHWLDVVRFGESNGYERNVVISDLWPFRDYVIRSFNGDVPFDELIREHLAGDALAGEPDQIIGSAFLVAGPYDDVGNQDAAQAAQIRANTIDEMIRASSEAFLGLTVGCARCHDHKFDPILQRDYYSWYATFAGVYHGSRIVATAEEQQAHRLRLAPLEEQREALSQQRNTLLESIRQRANEREKEFEALWTRDPPRRQGTEEVFAPMETKFVRLVSEGQDLNPEDVANFTIDEFDVWSVGDPPRNVALATNGGKAQGVSRQAEDNPDLYGPQLAIDGATGRQFISIGSTLTIELSRSHPH